MGSFFDSIIKSAKDLSVEQVAIVSIAAIAIYKIKTDYSNNKSPALPSRLPIFSRED